MKPLSLLLLCCCIHFQLFAQQARVELTENSIVKDSAGNIYPFVIWRSIMSHPDYEIRAIDNNNPATEFLLVQLTEAQTRERMERMPKPRESTYFRTGKEFSAFKTSDTNHNKINLREARGKIIVLNFWFINCPPCRMEIPSLNELVEIYKGNDTVLFIGVALDDKYNIQEFLKSFPFNYHIVHEGKFIADQYGIRGYPTHVVIDQEGKVYFHTTGLALNTVWWLKKSIAELLRQPPVAKR